MTQYLVSKKAAAAFFGVSVQALDGWFNRGAPSGVRSGRELVIDLAELVRWRIGQAAEGELERERTRLTKAQADKTEFEAAELAGNLIRAEHVIETWAQMAGAMRSRLLSMPQKVAPRARAALSDEEAAAQVEAEVLEALQELSTDGLPDAARARRERAAADTAAPSEADSESVGGQVSPAVGRKRGRAGAVEN